MNDIYREPYVDMLGNAADIDPCTHFGGNVRLGRNVVIESGCSIGENTIIGHNVVMRPGTIIGANCVVGHGTVFEGDSVTGNRVTIHAQCHITKTVVIEDDVFIGPMFLGTNTVNIKHGRPNIELVLKAFHAKRACRIGACVTAYPGVVIGENAMVGFGSLITRSIPDKQLWYGHPAKYIRLVPEEEWL